MRLSRLITAAVSFVIIGYAGHSSRVCAADSSPQPVIDQALINYLQGVIQTKNQADSAFIFMDAPGSTQTMQTSGLSAGIVETPIVNNLKTKELVDLNWGLYSTPRPGEKSSGSAINSFIDKHSKLYCSASSGAEQNLNPSCDQITSDMEHADLRVSTLLGPTMYNDAQKDSADNVVRTLSLPFPSEELSDAISNGLSTVPSKQFAANMMAQNALINVARNSLNSMWSMRVPTAIADNNENGGSSSSNSTKDKVYTSVLSVMENESGRRFKSSNWYSLVDQSSSEALLRELAHIEAFKLWMDYHKYKQNERIEALLASMLSIQANQSISLLISKNASSSNAD